MTEYNMSSSLDHLDTPPSTQQEDKSILTEDVIKKMISERHLSPSTLTSLMHPQAESLNLDLLATLVAHIHTTQAPGAILVFLPGWEDISYLAGLLTSSFHLPRLNVSHCTAPCPLKTRD